MVGAAPLVPDRTICNPINDFKLGGVALIDTSLSFVVSDMLNPPQQSTPNAALTRGGFIQRKRKGSVQQHSHEPRPIISQTASRGVLISATIISHLYRTTANIMQTYYKQLLREFEAIK